MPEEKLDTFNNDIIITLYLPNPFSSTLICLFSFSLSIAFSLHILFQIFSWGVRYRITELMYLHRRTEDRNLCTWVCLCVSLCLLPRRVSTQVCVIDFSSSVPPRQRKPHFKTFLPQVTCVLQRLSSLLLIFICVTIPPSWFENSKELLEMNQRVAEQKRIWQAPVLPSKKHSLALEIMHLVTT